MKSKIRVILAMFLMVLSCTTHTVGTFFSAAKTTKIVIKNGDITQSSCQAIVNAANELAPHTIANYLKELASDLHSFYSEHKILVEDETVKLARLALINATQQVLKNGLNLLGVSAPNKM